MIGDEKVRELFEAMKVTESITAVGFFIHNERVFDWRDLTRMTSFGLDEHWYDLDRNRSPESRGTCSERVAPYSPMHGRALVARAPSPVTVFGSRSRPRDTV